MPAAKAAPMALVINELIAGLLHDSFPDNRSGRVSITIVKFSREFRIEIAHDGVSPPGSGQGTRSAPETDSDDFGRTIVELLVRQLQARIDREGALTSGRVAVTLPLEMVRVES